MSRLTYRTLRENVVDMIRMKIISGDLKPGTKIVEQELANEFDISRGPIREALRQLEQEGMIEYTRNVGCYVRTIDIQDVYEIYYMRASYEMMAVKLCGGAIPRDVIDRMESVLANMSQITIGNFKDVFELDKQFHSEILTLVDLSRLKKAWEALEYGNVIIGNTTNLNQEAIIEAQYRIHKELLDAFKSGDMQVICTAIMDHYMKSVRKLMEEAGISTETFPYQLYV